MYSSLDVVKFDINKHMLVIDEWFACYDITPPDIDVIPPTGVIIEYDGKPVCAGFLVKTDCGVAMLTNFIADPKSVRETRSAALEYMLTTLIMMAEEAGFSQVAAATNLDAMAERFLAAKFLETDSNITIFGRSLCGD